MLRLEAGETRTCSGIEADVRGGCWLVAARVYAPEVRHNPVPPLGLLSVMCHFVVQPRQLLVLRDTRMQYPDLRDDLCDNVLIQWF